MNKKLKLYLLISTLCITPLFSFNNYIYAKNINPVESKTLCYKEMFPILKNLKQINKNQIEFSYDIPADSTKAITPDNYWIQSIQEQIPSGISSLGKNDTITDKNSLKSNMVEIKAKDSSNKDYIMTFKNDITPNMQYKLIICYVTLPGGTSFNGCNGSITFSSK